ncbi:uncharacterized protein HKW66_Vig0118980 [Vigna angularis]|uniref:Leucine-rich repeat-containing N-terminal plant-type domain-containing protein n=1 Tax=Phaseolus angularis TaxID=3914 RepID=A0A8T0JW44_PHAAN|nr:uncharacterized protein HKW66_Vig0118980 [Vigna angularis]
MKLKHNLIDPSNRLSSWNASLNPNCCQWHGVLCNYVTSHVVELHLNTPYPSFLFDVYEEDDEEVYEEAYKEYSRRAFSGEISPCLVDLKHLNYLDLSVNQFGRKPIPSFIATITSLTHLNLSRAGFMGNIPPQIGNLSNLLYLDFSYAANGTIPSQIGNLSNLLHLQLSEGYNENVDWLPSLSKLHYLDLSDNDSPGRGPIPDGLRNLTLLENLDLHGNSLSSIPHWLFGVLSHLKFLDLSGNNLQGNIPELENVTSLVKLDLSFNKLEGPIPTSLGKVTTLVKLDLSFNKLEGNLTLDYYGNKVDGEHPKSLGKLSSLRVLKLSSNKLGGNPFKSLGSLSKLLHLHIHDNHFQGVVNESHLENLTSLKEFYASGNNLALKVGRNWHPTFKLTSLDMSSWQLGPNFPSWIHSQNELQYLVMSNTGILDYIPHYFWEACYSLEYLNLSNNHIHGWMARSLK